MPKSGSFWKGWQRGVFKEQKCQGRHFVLPNPQPCNIFLAHASHFFDLLPAKKPQPLEPSKKPKSYKVPVLLTA